MNATRLRRIGALAATCAAATSLVLFRENRSWLNQTTAQHKQDEVIAVRRRSARSFETESQKRRNVLRVEYDPGNASLLGTGTYGTVRRGRDLISGNPVALKIVSKGLRSLKDEIEALRRVKECGGHPHIVRLLGVVSIENDASRCGMVFELLEGGELYESLVKHGAYSEHRASAVVRQVASALAFLHEKCHIAHADLKPENLLLRSSDPDGSIALCDFGSAVELDENGFFEFSDKRLLGTVAYAAPELLLSQYAPNPMRRMSRTSSNIERASSKVDVWSLGCILYVVLSGFHPFDPDNELSTDEELARAIIKGNFDFSAPAWKNVSASAKDLIMRMLERDPSKRISAKQVLDHDWVRLPQRKESISGSDVRLIGFLRTQRRLQDHVFHLMLDGSLKRGNRVRQVSGIDSSTATDDDERASLDEVFRQIDLEGKGFITRRDIERSLSKSDASMSSAQQITQQQHPSDADEDKLYYASLNGLVGCGERVSFRPGEVVFRKGDPANSFFYVDRGSVELSITGNEDGPPTLTLGAGDFFGETALLKNQPRNATVRAGSRGADLIQFSHDDFDRLVAGSSDALKMLDDRVQQRTLEHLKFVFSQLFNDRENIYLSYGDLLLKRGEPSESMYFIVDGVTDVINAKGEVVAQRKDGETVGELGLVTGEPRSMDIRCSAKRGCAFKKLDKPDLSKLLQFSPLAHAELQNALSSRGVGGDDGAVISKASSNHEDRDLRRRWTVAQGSAKAAMNSRSRRSGPGQTPQPEAGEHQSL